MTGHGLLHAKEVYEGLQELSDGKELNQGASYISFGSMGQAQTV